MDRVQAHFAGPDPFPLFDDFGRVTEAGRPVITAILHELGWDGVFTRQGLHFRSNFMHDTATAPSAFKITRCGILLSDHTKKTGVPARTYGDVARLSDGTLWARYSTPAGFVSQPYDPSTPLDAVAVSCAKDWVAHIKFLLGDAPAGFHVLEEPGETPDLARFRSDYPSVAERLGLSPSGGRPFRFFEPGPVRYPRTFGKAGIAGLPPDAWREMLERHLWGDFGLCGIHAETPLSQDQKWCLDREPIHVQNAVAIGAGRGAVRSKYALDEEHQSRFADRACQRAIDVVTVLNPNGNMTLFTLGVQ